MYILIMFIWLQGASSLESRQEGAKPYPTTFPTSSLCEQQGELLSTSLPSDITVEYSWQSPKCVFVEKPI